ncbi:MAG: hemerythrin domain-containing protein [Bacteroidales bacterium]|nr:hemerythrin domain-containing protein [Candidatus Liminaster caballi]
MKNIKMYEADDKMISLIRDDHSLLHMLSAFGIKLGFGDKTVREVCEGQEVDTYTFLTVVNFAINGHLSNRSIGQLSVITLLRYLRAAHVFFLDFELPFIRKELKDALDENDNLAQLILKLYDGYAHSLRSHMNYEEKTLFPYVEKLIDGKVANDTIVETFSKHHDQTDHLLTELKDIIIKYLPSDNLRNNQLSATLYDIFNSERMLYQHVEIEERIFLPAIRLLEQQCRQNDVSQRITNMITGGDEASQEALSEREKEIIVCVVQGMSNKEIADHLFIATNTVTTHRRNIARKLQIHSPAGLTIYAIVNNLVDISTVKL